MSILMMMMIIEEVHDVGLENSEESFNLNY